VCWCCLPLSKLIHSCRNYILPKLACFLRHGVDSIHCALQYHRRTLRPHINPKHNRAYQQRYGTASTWSKIDYGSKIGERPSGRKTTTVKLDNTLMRAVDGRLLIAQGDVVYVWTLNERPLAAFLLLRNLRAPSTSRRNAVSRINDRAIAVIKCSLIG